MKAARKLPVSAFKQQCLKLLDDQKLKEQPLAVSRRGKVVALVTAPESAEMIQSFKGSIKFLKKGWESADFSADWRLG